MVFHGFRLLSRYPSVMENYDQIVTPDAAAIMFGNLGCADLDDARCNPVFGQWELLPPLFIAAGGDEYACPHVLASLSASMF